MAKHVDQILTTYPRIPTVHSGIGLTGYRNNFNGTLFSTVAYGSGKLVAVGNHVTWQTRQNNFCHEGIAMVALAYRFSERKA